MKEKHIMFDFDGTLADTSEGIISSMHYAYDKLGLAREKDEKVRNIIGPPLEEMFSILLNTKDDEYIKKCVRIFRERYSKEGVRELCLYPKVKQVLSELVEVGCKLYIVTSKPEAFVREICKAEGIDNYFTAITGVALDKKSLSKADRMKLLMDEQGFEAFDAIMVGDRPEDANAAAKNGVRCVGVTYGFGKKEELVQAGCSVVIDDIEKLVKNNL